MANNGTEISRLIGAILSEASSLGSNGLPITFLTKFLYLADVYHAEAFEKQKLTNLEWKFHHFGPYAESLPATIDAMLISGELNQIPVADKDYNLLAWARDSVSFEELGLAAYISIHLKSAIKKYRFNLNSLLNFVYFNTSPMMNVDPGDTLTFENCLKTELSDLKPISLKRPNKKKEEKIRALIKKIEANYVEGSKQHLSGTAPIYDETYLLTVQDDSPNTGNINLRLNATLSISHKLDKK